MDTIIIHLSEDNLTTLNNALSEFKAKHGFSDKLLFDVIDLEMLLIQQTQGKYVPSETSKLPFLLLSPSEKRVAEKLSTEISVVFAEAKHKPSKRLVNVIKSLHYEILADICQNERSDFIRITNLGRKTLSEIELILHEHGLGFDMDLTRYCISPTAPKIKER